MDGRRRYITKQVPIFAVKWTGDNFDRLVEEGEEGGFHFQGPFDGGRIEVVFNEVAGGVVMRAHYLVHLGNWIVRTPTGVTVMGQDDFEAYAEPMMDEPSAAEENDVIHPVALEVAELAQEERADDVQEAEAEERKTQRRRARSTK